MEEEKIQVEPILVVPAKRSTTAANPPNSGGTDNTTTTSANGEQQPENASQKKKSWSQKKTVSAGGGSGGGGDRRTGGQDSRDRKPSEANRKPSEGNRDRKPSEAHRDRKPSDVNRKPSEANRDRKQSAAYRDRKGSQGGGGGDHKATSRSGEGDWREHNKTNPPQAGQTEKEKENANGQSAADKSAADRRNSFKKQRVFSSSTSKKSTERRPSDGQEKKPRVFSKSQSQDQGARKASKNGDEKKRTASTASNGKMRSQTSNSVNSNGESFDYDDDFDLDEPFSDSEDESPRVPQKPTLVIPRGRIRTLSGTVPPVGHGPKWGGPTMCLSCLMFFELPDSIGDFAAHLLDEHRIVIEEVDLIVDPKRYVEHWRQRFAKESVDKVFPKIVPEEGNPLFGKVDYYYEMSERIPEDYSLRQRLAMRRLEEALACQQREREETNFAMPCIFCRYVARGNRSKIIHHLYMIHHLNLGSPDNLVFVHEYIDHLKEKLQRNECIYCEKTFADRNVLMDHMRKRNHREVNPKNNYYDKFYIINYLELGKRWLDVLAEDFEDTMPTFVDSDDEEEEESWHEWQEDNIDEDEQRVLCIFCDDSHEKITTLLEHFSEAHKFDLVEHIRENKLDMYDRMKLLNHLRKLTFNKPGYRARSANGPKLAEIPERSEWDVPDNLVPMFDNDHLLWTFESFLQDEHPDLATLGEAITPEMLQHQADDCKAMKSATVEGERKERRHSLSIVDPKAVIGEFIEESKRNTVENVIPEDFPDFSKSALADEEVFKQLR